MSNKSNSTVITLIVGLIICSVLRFWGGKSQLKVLGATSSA